ncbi:hypothetical protein V2G26_010875 [Clonostachys chloroleuca]
MVFKNRGSSLRHRVTTACGAGFLLFGYDQGVFGGLLSNQHFLDTFNNPNSTMQGQIVATYDIGCIMGTIVSMIWGEKLGRRKCVSVGCVILIIGGILQAASYSIVPMIVGRIVAGIGNGMNTIAIPIWQSETAKAENRGKLIVLQLVTNIFGIVITNWMNYGFTYVTHSAISWRFPLAFECFFALVTIAMVFIAPESPRWLIMTERVEEATSVIAILNEKPENDPAIVEEVSLLVASVNHVAHQQSAVSVKEIFYKNEKMNWGRILLGAGTPFFQQFGGVNVIAYYLPVVLVRSFGMSDRLALILSAVDSMSLMFWGALASLLIDRIGRRRLMMWGVLCSGVCFCVVAIGLRYGGPGSSNGRASTVAVAFIFLYYVFHGLSMLSFPYMYPPEINSQRMRNVGTSIATAVNWISVYIVVVITPIAIDNVGWKYYLIYAVFNFAFVPIIYRWYVETANLSLEQVDRLFAVKYNDKNLRWKQAEKQAREETPAIIEAKIKDAEHVEVVGAKDNSA